MSVRTPRVKDVMIRIKATGREIGPFTRLWVDTIFAPAINHDLYEAFEINHGRALARVDMTQEERGVPF